MVPATDAVGAVKLKATSPKVFVTLPNELSEVFALDTVIDWSTDVAAL